MKGLDKDDMKKAPASIEASAHITLVKLNFYLSYLNKSE